MISDDKYFPQYVSEPVDDWLNTCDRIRTDVEMYSDNFLQTFENSDFFTTCKKQSQANLNGKSGVIAVFHVVRDHKQKSPLLAFQNMRSAMVFLY